MQYGKFYATFSGSPLFNMAMDEWMFQRAINNTGSILLRLYTWSSGAITFGYNQNENKVVNRDLLNGTPLIRRVTGGRALYHEPTELTYSIAVNCAGIGIDAFKQSLSQSSRTISLALLEFLCALEIKANYVRNSSAHFLSKDLFHTQPCFQSHSRHEIVGENGKIIASAQRRIGDAFLQHGSIKISGIAHHPALASMPTNYLDIKDIQPLGSSSFRNFADLFSCSMGQSLGIAFDLEELSQEEFTEVLAMAAQLKEKRLIRRELIAQISHQVSLSTE